jgi:hypothetical protein
MVHLGTWAVSVVERATDTPLILKIKGVHFVAARNEALAKELVARKKGVRESDCIAVLIRMDSTPMSTPYWQKKGRSLERYIGPLETHSPIPKVECKSCGGSGKVSGGDDCPHCSGTGLQKKFPNPFVRSPE